MSVTPSPSAPGVTPPAAVAAPATWASDQLVENWPDRPVFLAWPVVPDAAPLGTAVRAWLDERLEVFRADEIPSEEAPPELNGQWAATLDEPDGMVGVRVELYEFSGANGALTSATFHAERGATAALSGRDLVADESADAFADATLAALRAAGHPVLDDLAATPAAREALLADLTFTRAGELVVRVGEGVVAPFSEGEVDAVVPAEVAEGLLSPNGRRVRDAYAAVGPIAAPTPPAPAATPTPAPVATPTAPPTPSSSAAPSSSATPSASPASSGAAGPGTPAAPAASGTAAGSVDCAATPCVALTFDDGPGPHTARLLDLLAARKAPATFFLLGQNVARQPGLVRRMAAEGHEIGNHTWDHQQLTKLGRTGQREEVERAAAAIAAAGATPTVFRPPYGSRNATTDAVAGAPVILWDVDTLDWKTRDTDATVAAALRDTRRGSIVLMHDIHAPTVAAVPRIIDGLRERGYTLVTVSQLLGDARPGVVHRRRQGADAGS